MGHHNTSYTGPMLDVEPQQIHHHHNHHPESCMVSYNGLTCFQPFNTRTIIPPSINFDPRYLPENHGHLPYMITQYNGEHCNTFMIPSPNGGPFSVPNNHQIFERNGNMFMDGSNSAFKRSSSSFVGPMTSERGAMGFDPAVSLLVHGGQSVRAVPGPWLDHHGVSGAFSWNRAHGVPYMQGCINGGYTSFMHPPHIRSHHGPHNVYHPPPLPPPPMPPVQAQNIDIHLQMPSTSHRHSTNGVDLGPRFMGPMLPPGLRVYEAHRQELMIDSSARHLRVLPQDEILELGELIGNVDSGLSDNFISKNLKTRTFSHFEDLVLSVEEPDLCVICQMEFEEQEEIGMLNCWHEYHAECIKKWLLVKNNCPICKSTGLT